jgi:HSP20 family protein
MSTIRSMWPDLEALWRTAAAAGAPDEWAPPVRVEEDDLGWRMTVDLPGVAPEDLAVEQRGAGVRIEAVRRLGEGRTLRLARALELPAAADAGRLEARLEHGVLTLLVPRAERFRPRRLEVRPGGAPVLEAGREEVVS